MPVVNSLHDRIAAGRQALVDAGFSTQDAALDADVLARHVLGWDLARLLAHNREPAPSGFSEQFESAISRRVRHEPVALIVGHREFWGLDFEVTPATLVPRPETEVIVEEALRLFPAGTSPGVLDVGTGTGCLAVAIAVERRHATVIATDISHGALLVARRNARAHGVSGQVRFVCADLAGGVQAHADLIVSNPPYVPDEAASTLPADVLCYEPAPALFGGSDGLSVIRRLFASAANHLAPGGAFIVEFGLGQADTVRQLASDHGWQAAGLLHDLQGIPRALVLRR
jgi:release factor glutamine methyltransferase